MSVINYSTHPILRKLTEGRLNEVPIFETDYAFLGGEQSGRFREEWAKKADLFKETHVVHQEFFEKMGRAQSSLNSILDAVVQETGFEMGGTFIFHNDYVHMMHIKIEKGGELKEYTQYSFHPNGMPLSYSHCDSLLGKEEWTSTAVQATYSSKEEQTDLLTFTRTVCLHAFICKLSEKADIAEVKGNSEKKIKQTTCINETEMPIQYLVDLDFSR